MTHLTDGNGTVIERYKYDAFGVPTFYDGAGTQISSTAYNNRFLFTGREYDGAGVYEYRARLYHSVLGRFMSEDPKLFDAGDYNLFRYCHNDPIDFTDAMGTTDDPVPTHAPQAKANDQQTSRQNLANQMAHAAARARAYAHAHGWPGQSIGPIAAANYASQMSEARFNVEARPVSLNPNGIGASGSVITITFKDAAGQTGTYEFDQYLSNGTWNAKANQLIWSGFKRDLQRNGGPPLPGQRQIPGGVTVRDQPGHWDEGSRPGSRISAHTPLGNFLPFGQRMITSAFRIAPDGNSTFVGSHFWGATYQEGRFPQYEGTAGWFTAVHP